MDLKSEEEIKEEELDLDHNSYEDCSQIFPDNKTYFASPNGIKIKEFEEIYIKTEFREIEEESMLDKEQDNATPPERMGKMSSHQHGEIFHDGETDFASPNGIKIKEFDEIYIKSELGETEEESMLDKEQVNNATPPEMIGKMSSHQHGEIFSDIETDFALPNGIKIKEFDEIYIKSEWRETEEESMLDKEQVNNATTPEMIGKMSSYQHGENLVGVADQGEQGSKLKSSGSKPLTSVTFDQVIKGNCQDCLRCKFCNFIFKYKYELMSHLKTHDKKEFKCAHCSFECKRKDNLKSHLLIHSNLKLFKCSECSYENNHKSNLKIHQLTHSKLKLFKCCKCGSEFSSTGNLKRHMATHNNLKLFKCSECSYECNRKDYLKTHLLSHNKNLKLLKCSECSYECDYKSDLKRHLLTHDNLKLFKCSECSFECKQKGDLKRHMLTHSNLKLFKCSECSYECNRKSDFKIHVLNHSNLKLFKCSECSYECNHKGTFKNHLLIHSNLKLFKCSECSFECKQKGHLKRHMLTHSNLKLFKCSECSYECNRKDYLKSHLLNHSNLKLFKCFECSFECNHKSSFQNHRLTHSNLKLFKCSECSYECKLKGNLKKHILKMHKTATINKEVNESTSSQGDSIANGKLKGQDDDYSEITINNEKLEIVGQ